MEAASRSQPQSVALLDSIRVRFRQASPAIDEVSILEVRTPGYLPPDRRRALLAWGVRKDHTFRGSFNDELFGVFIVNDSLTRIVRTLEIIPTPRWLDYAMRIDRVTVDSVFVRGEGATYRDGPMVRSYGW
jgi:hypothetical protein